MLKQIELIEQIDQLIRLKATGSPVELATKLDISKTKLYRTLYIMKELNAPIEFDTSSQSYYYTDPIEFSCGFFL
jgi:predicted DNA-binding transcriptional regulator YafY